MPGIAVVASAEEIFAVVEAAIESSVEGRAVTPASTST
jgi:hypothetical protein